MFGDTKGGNLHFVQMQNNILANQKTELSGDAHMQGLMLLAFSHLSKHWTSFQVFCRDVYFLCGNYIGLLAEIVSLLPICARDVAGLYVTVNFTALLFCGSFISLGLMLQIIVH